MAIGVLRFADEDGAGIAQAAEQRFCKPPIGVSITSAGSNIDIGDGD